ncbi:MAG: DUF5106 domain-containing protein [Bacteroidales bacterium]|nr:DUF5106 domain-containing protein [Bacteroidales bacterium]MBP3663466.1 DUF5106 domain-containing protein [Bacteroidales bacterium]MBQ7876969.1 DUF5106 domain-containing protein [Bacteroidales bacterium]
MAAVSAVLIVAGCGQRKAEQFQALPFPDVLPPAMMEDPQDRAEYMAQNMWNSLTDPSRTYPCDSLLVSGVRRTDVEQKFANWTQVLGMSSRPVAEKSVSRLYDRALACEKKDTSSNVFETFASLVDKYLFDPNSPLRDEDLYGAYASRLAAYEGYTEVQKEKYARDARLCALNKVGTKAADFRFADRRGKIRTLYGVEAPYTLLFFSNPGCEACMSIINVLKEDPQISSMISSGRLKVLNIYIDEDLDAWRSYMPVYPDEWYNGFDPDFVIRNETLYNVRAIPSLYLLDSDKTVLLKDAPENRMFEYLYGL